MKRLFCVKSGKGTIMSDETMKGVADTRYFSNKMQAKEFRDRLNEHKTDFHVARGPDHWRGES